jgi:superfamily II DNA helicase RecQ
MNAILGYTQLMLRDPSLGLNTKTNLKIIGRSGEHLLTLINDVLDMSRIEAGRTELKPATFNLSGLLNDLAAMFRLRAVAKALRFEMVVDGESVRQSEYAQSNQCRMSSLVRHFGDTADSQKPCGICDFCAPESCVAQQFRDASQKEQFVARDVIRALLGTGRSVGKLHTELCTKNGMDRGAFEELIGSMARAALISLVDSVFEKDGKQIPFRRASLTGDGERVDAGASFELKIRETAAPFVDRGERKSRKKRSPLPAKQKSHKTERSQGSAAAAKLKAWRRAMAAKQGVPAFRVMSDRVLLAIAENEPATAAELLAIPGIGIKLVEKYAAQIYRILDESRV